MLQVLEIGARPLPGTPRGALVGTCASARQMPGKVHGRSREGGDGDRVIGCPGGFWRYGLSLDVMQWGARQLRQTHLLYLLFNSKPIP